MATKLGAILHTQLPASEGPIPWGRPLPEVTRAPFSLTSPSKPKARFVLFPETKLLAPGETMKTQEMLQTLARHLGIEGFGSTEDGYKQLVFDEEIVVVFDDTKNTEGIWMWTEIAPLPEQQRETLLRRLLQANIIAAHRREPVVTLFHHHICLQYFLNIEGWTASQIISDLEKFLNKAETWKKQLASIPLPTKESFEEYSLYRDNMLRP